MKTPSRKFEATLANDADLSRMWRRLIRPLGWRVHQMYLMFVDEDRHVLPHVVEVHDMPAGVSRRDARQFTRSFAHLVGAEGLASLAILLARPGTGGLTDLDRATCRHLYEAARHDGLQLELIHVATGTAITPAPRDEVHPLRAS
ncbi:hypothetical protein [Nocardioides montaniterrae]